MAGTVTVVVRQRKISRAMAHFKSRMISFFVRPTAVCRAV